MLFHHLVWLHGPDLLLCWLDDWTVLNLFSCCKAARYTTVHSNRFLLKDEAKEEQAREERKAIYALEQYCLKSFYPLFDFARNYLLQSDERQEQQKEEKEQGEKTPILNLPRLVHAWHDQRCHSNTIDILNAYVAKVQTIESISIGNNPLVYLPCDFLPSSLKTLKIGMYCHFQSHVLHKWPRSLEVLDTGDSFNSFLHFVTSGDELTPHSFLPPNLKVLICGDAFNHLIEPSVLPRLLERLSFGDRFDKTLSSHGWPSTLFEIKFGRDFNRPVNHVQWPASLETLDLSGECFNQPLDGPFWPPPLLKTLRLGKAFRYPLNPIPSLKHLYTESCRAICLQNMDLEVLEVSHGALYKLCGTFSFSWHSSFVLPRSLKTLNIIISPNDCRSGSLVGVRVPSVAPLLFLKEMKLHSAYGLMEFDLAWPQFYLSNSLVCLDFGHYFNQELAVGLFPACLKKLILGRSFCRILTPGMLPPFLETVDIGEANSQGIILHESREYVPIYLPASLQELIVYSKKTLSLIDHSMYPLLKNAHLLN